jgi:hypothetical protein
MPAERGVMDAWVLRVLGVDPAAKTNDSQAWRGAVDRWRSASDAVDAQLSDLARVLLATGDPALKPIAQFGLGAIIANHRVRLVAAIAGLGEEAGSAAFQKGAKKAIALLRAFRAHIEADRRVAVCDGNPYGARVSIRATLGPALEQMQSVLELAGAAA